MKTSFFESFDGKKIYTTEWLPEEGPVAVVQIVHGMCEYIGRYDEFARYLNGFGIAVAGDDHRGHGRTAEDRAELGFFGSRDGWKHMVRDEKVLTDLLREEHPGVPVVLLGHSMGSFIARAYLAEYGEGLAGAVIMGTAGSNPALGAGLSLVKLLRAVKGERSKSRLATALAFGSYSKRIKEPVNNFSWLSRDDELCLRYAEDPLCRFTFTLAGYEDLMSMLKYINSAQWYRSVPKDLTYLLCSGWEDPVGDYGKGPAEVTERLQEAGCGDVSLLLYEGMRHEILNEIGKQAVWEDMRDFVLDMAEEAADGGEG